MIDQQKVWELISTKNGKKVLHNRSMYTIKKSEEEKVVTDKIGHKVFHPEKGRIL